MGGVVPTIDLLVVQPTPFCNIDCKYCYLPNRSSKAVVARATLESLFSQIFASGWLGDALSVVWHAGEPMVLPITFYRDAFALVEELRPPELPVVHSFQTNGTLIDDAWCGFFAEAQINLGVSIDGPRHFHDRNRLTRSGRGTFERTIAGIRLLRRHGIPFHVISVLTSASMAASREMFDFYVAEGIERVCFNVEESEGDHVSQSFGEAGIEAAYYRFLSEFWRLSAAAPGKITFLREIEQALQQVIRPKEAPFRNQLVEPFAITSMDCNGNIATFSPELLGLKNPAYDDFVLGNIARDRLVDLRRSPVLARMQADIDAGVALCRAQCEYFSVCGGGEPVNKLTENGSFASTETAYCRVTKMRATDLVLDALERMSPAEPEPEPDDRVASGGVRAKGRPQPRPSAKQHRRSGGEDEKDIALVGHARHRRRNAGRIGRGRIGARRASRGMPAGPGSHRRIWRQHRAVGGHLADRDRARYRTPGALRHQRRDHAHPDPAGAGRRPGYRAGRLAGLEFAGIGPDLRRQAARRHPRSSVYRDDAAADRDRDRFFPVSAVFPLEEGHAFKGVRVRGSENAIEVDQIPGTKTVKISLNDCKDCVGKKFAERGQAAPGRPGSFARRIFPKSCAGSRRLTGSAASPTTPTG